jgi:hypothetical protein
LRLKRICNSENAFEEKLRELKVFLVKRGYNSDFVDDQFGRVRKVDRNNLLMWREGVKNSNRNCFVIDYDPTSFAGSFFGEGKTLVGAGHVAPRFWVLN